jgi:hypothetical protein
LFTKVSQEPKAGKEEKRKNCKEAGLAVGSWSKIELTKIRKDPDHRAGS